STWSASSTWTATRPPSSSCAARVSTRSSRSSALRTKKRTEPGLRAQVQSMNTRIGSRGVERATRALQDAIDRAADSGGGRVTIAPGVHETGALRLRSHVELHLEAGAVLRFVADPALYPPVGA